MPTAEQVAKELMVVMPQVMRTIRLEMRRNRMHNLSVPQFRTLAIVERCPQVSLVELAEQLGLTAPSTCTLIDGLAERGLVERNEVVGDRRRIAISLTEKGLDWLECSRRATEASLAAELKGLSITDLEQVHQAIRVLRPIFLPERWEKKSVEEVQDESKH
jgi:DNA-binding MarR family transcriptional regulator